MIKSLKAEQARAAARAREAESLWLHKIDRGRVPRHVAVIMDGNGRWAQQRGWPRIMGHQAGAQTVRQVVEAARELNVPVLTLYTFSAENWRRPADEVEALLALVEQKIREEIDELDAQGVRVRLLGRMEQLPESLQQELHRDMERTAHNTALQLFLALDYGGRAEIVEAARRIAVAAREGRLKAEELTEESFAEHLYAPGVPDPELLIRTGGEMRVSNFLLWQIAYTELWITPILWPDFSKAEFYHALYDFQQRKRRFGGLEEGL